MRQVERLHLAIQHLENICFSPLSTVTLYAGVNWRYLGRGIRYS